MHVARRETKQFFLSTTIGERLLVMILEDKSWKTSDIFTAHFVK